MVVILRLRGVHYVKRVHANLTNGVANLVGNVLGPMKVVTDLSNVARLVQMLFPFQNYTKLISMRESLEHDNYTKDGILRVVLRHSCARLMLQIILY